MTNEKPQSLSSKAATESVQSKDQNDPQTNSLENDPQTNSLERIFARVEDYGIVLLDPKGTIISWNKGAELIKGYKPEDVIGRNYNIFYTKEDRAIKLSEKLLDEARTKGRTNYEGWRVRKDGSQFWGSITLTAVTDENGRVVSFLKVVRDLTDKKSAEDKLGNIVDELQHKNEELKRSEQKYHSMIAEVSDYAIILLDGDGKVLDWNVGAQKLKGYERSEIIGKSFKLFYPKEEKESKLPERLLSEAAANGSVIHEGWRIRKDGRRFWGNVAITALHDSEGNIIGYSKVTRDLTEKKMAEDRVANIIEELQQTNEKLKQSEERYHKMIDEVQDYAIVLLSPSGDILNWNTGAEFIKGYAPSDIIGKNFRIFYNKEDREAGLPDKLLAEAGRSGRVVHEGWRLRKDGTNFWGSIVITALHNAAGEIIGYSKVTRDLTERRNAEEALKVSASQLSLKNRTLERLNAELSSFSYIASHDLKEPLRKIQTFAGRIEEATDLTGTSKAYVKKISESASRMQKLIHDLLAYSEVSNDESTFSKVDLNEIVRSVLADLEVAIQEKKATIKLEKLPVVSGVQHQFTQLFYNLLSNSLKFSKRDTAPVLKIESRIIRGPNVPGISQKVDTKYYHISVSDNGIGFESEFASQIFQAFQRLHSKSEFSGTGIGLAIVKKVVENHHGIVEAQSTPGEGSVFNIYLPINN